MSKKTVLTLKNIDASQILIRHYGSTFSDHETEIPETSLEVEKEIDIADLLKEKSPRCIYFLDNHKQKMKYWVNMIDVTQGMALPMYTTKPCWWHRAPFKTHPLGIPIRYSPHHQEGLEKNRLDERFQELNYSSETNEFFETIGMVCSFPCMKAYILDQLSRNRSSRFKESLTLMTLLYSKMFGKIITIPTAPPWKIQIDWGGHLTPKEYTSTFGRLEYTETVNVRRPYMFSSSGYIQETRVRL